MKRNMIFAMGLCLVTGLAGVAGAAEKTAEQVAAGVEISRTAYGVPHIKADSLYGVAFGLAYCQAEDHAPTIMRLVLKARGESAKWFEGRSHAESDFLNRQFRVKERAAETFHKLDPDFRSMFEGYAAGYNYYAKLHADEMPEYYSPLTPHDAAAHGLMGVARFAFNRGGTVQQFIRKKGQEAQDDPNAEKKHDDAAFLFDDSGQLDPESAMMGSNMWALAPSRTESGNAILMGNPHQGWTEVATYYEAHLTVPGQLDFYGSTFIGRPVLTTGFNKNLGWSHTVNYPDLEEIYELDRAPGRADQFLFDGGTLQITQTASYVEVLTDGQHETEMRMFYHTPLGPVIHQDAEHVYVLRSAAFEEYRFYQQWLRMSQASNLEEFKEALAMQAVPMFNIAYADREGNIFYIWNGTMPKYPHEAHSAEAVPASGSDDIWTRFHAEDELPQLLNPKGGYVQNCNMPPWFTTLQEIMDPADYPPYFMGHRFSPRTQHCLKLLEENEKWTLEKSRDLKFSLGMELANLNKSALLEALKAANPDAKTKEAIALLEAWDNTVAAESRGSVLFVEWWDTYTQGKLSMGPDLFEVGWTPEKPLATPRGLADKEKAVAAMGVAIKKTEEKWRSMDVAWGEVHRVRKGDVDLPVGGGSGFIGCFRVLGFKNAEDGKRVVSGGDSWVFTVEFGDQPRAYTVVGYSQSGDPDSPHYTDQAKLFTENKMKRAAFTPAEIDAQLLQRYRPGQEKR